MTKDAMTNKLNIKEAHIFPQRKPKDGKLCVSHFQIFGSHFWMMGRKMSLREFINNIIVKLIEFIVNYQTEEFQR